MCLHCQVFSFPELITKGRDASCRLRLCVCVCVCVCPQGSCVLHGASHAVVNVSSELVRCWQGQRSGIVFPVGSSPVQQPSPATVHQNIHIKPVSKPTIHIKQEGGTVLARLHADPGEAPG